MKPDNPQAFPGPDQAEQKVDIHEGMTLRDYFAAKAMQVICAANPHTTDEDVANFSYLMADQMLRRRVK